MKWIGGRTAAVTPSRAAGRDGRRDGEVVLRGLAGVVLWGRVGWGRVGLIGAVVQGGPV